MLRIAPSSEAQRAREHTTPSNLDAGPRVQVMTEAQKDLSSLSHGIKQPIVCSRCANEGRQLATDFRAILRQKWTAKSGS